MRDSTKTGHPRQWPRLACELALAALVMLAREAPAADPAKTLRVAFSIAESSFDPQFNSDAASDSIIDNIFDAMLTYDYLARPVKLVPRTLEAMPEVGDSGSTYTFRFKKGIFFTPDPAFGGKPRELIAADQAYAIRRLLDPAVRSPWLWLVEFMIVGADAVRAQALKTGKFDYEAPIAGLELVDRYTLRIRLTQPDLRFLYAFAVPNTAPIAREVVAAYGVDIGAHPVGTGPYMLSAGEYKRSSKIVLVANPGYRETTYVPAGPIPADSQPIADALKGKKLPLPGRIEVSVIEEGQATWLAFLNRELDLLERLPPEFVDQALVGGKLKPELMAAGIHHHPLLRPNTWWTYFNMEDPVVGGYTPEKIALRRAIGMGYDVDEFIRIILKGRATPAMSPIPPDIAGYDPELRTQAQLYDPAAARALLDKFGYKDRDGDGYRETPDGKPLVLERWSAPTTLQRQADEQWKKNMDAIGLRIVFRKDRLPELRKMARAGKIPMRTDGWNADYPDAENYMQLLYGPNAGPGLENQARFRLPEFDKLYEAARKLPDSPERTKLFDRMTELVLAYAPWRLQEHRIEDQLGQKWIRNYRPHPIRSEVWRYIDVDLAQRPK
ncbi:MAG TPA: ABC transporter substrate-binding protein [Casimicrobiaceae bacterium]|nr:ABC transporter substrate-binding protein [Casimicrobiaceae bacterium]